MQINFLTDEELAKVVKAELLSKTDSLALEELLRRYARGLKAGEFAAGSEALSLKCNTFFADTEHQIVHAAVVEGTVGNAVEIEAVGHEALHELLFRDGEDKRVGLGRLSDFFRLLPFRDGRVGVEGAPGGHFGSECGLPL